jgi:hypothetical protein
MQFIANGLKGTYLRSVLPGPAQEIDGVLATIAYGNDHQTLLQNCLDNGLRLDIWMRYDHSVPVSPDLLKRFPQSAKKNIFCYQVENVGLRWR